MRSSVGIEAPKNCSAIVRKKSLAVDRDHHSAGSAGGSRAIPGPGSPWAVVAHDQTVRRRKDGRLVHVSWIISPVRDFDARIVGSSAIVQDISERIRSEEARERLAAVVESSDDAIVGKNLDGTITAWNSGAERLFGYSSSEAMGQPISMLLPPDRANEEADILARVRRGESVKHFRNRARPEGRHTHWRFP